MTGGRDIEGALVEFAKVDWEASAPRSIFFDDIYFAGDGAAEASHVFLDGNNLGRRFGEADRFAIGELGFGSGLNFLSAWALWRAVRRPAARLHFLSFEKYPLRADDLVRASAAWPHLQGFSEALARAYPPPVAGFHRLALAEGVTLTLAFGDASMMLTRCEASIDAWFLDGFAPAKCPGMWSDAVFAEIARLSAKGATAATFTVAGAVRRGLEAAGFAIEKRPGYGRKREMLTAAIDAPPRPRRRAPWFSPSALPPLLPGARLAIIGGGVAGASLADAAARAGLIPTLIDNLGLANAASGNPAGLIMPRLDLGNSAGGRFFIAAYLCALRTIERLETETGAVVFNRCGAFQPSLADDDAARAARQLTSGILPEGWIEARDRGVYFPQAGVIDPRAFCSALAGATAIIRTRAIRINRTASGIEVFLEDGSAVAADAVVIANGADALRFAEARTLPLTRVGGQIDWFPDAAPPASAVAFGPYAAPARGGGLIIGATYDRLGANAQPQARIGATQLTIDAIAAALPDLAASLDAKASRPRASVRCQTPDRLPIAGPAPDFHFYGAEYDDLRTGKARDYPDGRSIPGVFLLTGLGSRGLVTAPLLADMIVAEMTGAPAPVERDIAEALHPARFFIRDLKRAVTRRAM
ncbi:MAG: bifunctional tRNA (5-methylaminomethyl-2-thiouridine)(34)-methyltransferase MnmD/FAD-dependent 5-carboxymethylaminomethyl-2-thiouridine(34) oxidoreductase MnmC [Parvularculaceae bacterium]